MDSLPMAPASCTLDESTLREQLARYRQIGRAGRLVEHDPRRLVVEVRAEVPETVIERLLAVERDCCPFFELDWRASARRLTVGVSSSSHEQALAAIASALGD